MATAPLKTTKSKNDRYNVGAGELNDFPAFYSTFERVLRATLVQIVGLNDLDDLVQLTFLRCWQKRDSFQGRSSLKTWVVRIAINLAKDHLRQRRSELAYVHAGEFEGFDAVRAPQLLENQQLMAKAMAGLTVDHRAVIALVYFQECTIEETAELLEEPLGTIKSRLHYARQAIADALTRLGVKV